MSDNVTTLTSKDEQKTKMHETDNEEVGNAVISVFKNEENEAESSEVLLRSGYEKKSHCLSALKKQVEKCQVRFL